MALPSTVYRATIQLSHVDRGVYETLQTTIARHPSETAERVIIRLLAYALCYEDGLVFTKGICAGDEPDLWAKGPDGRVTLWVEVGVPDPERLLKAARHSERAVLIACGPNRFRWDEQHLKKMTGTRNLTILGLDYDFISQIAQKLERNITWEITISDGVIYLTANGASSETTISPLS
jgi:uncharacterized protein YaeQ